MKIFIASDHAGLFLKNKIKEYIEGRQINTVDLGTDSEIPVDYPDFAQKLVSHMKKHENSRGILICGTGIGMSIAANRFPQIYATLCHDELTAELSRKHNNSNILILGARVTDFSIAKKIVEIWLNTKFEGSRHSKRLLKIDSYSN